MSNLMRIEVSGSVARIVDALNGRGVMTLDDLAVYIGVRVDTARAVVRAAENAGLVERQRGRNLGGGIGCEPSMVRLRSPLPGFVVRKQNGKTVKTKRQLFEERVKRQDGCWGWSGHVSNGYAYMRPGGRSGALIGAHRVSYELHCGPVPDGLFVCHHCDNPICTNPDHLFIGTPADNNADMMSKGRHRPAPRYEMDHHNCKLSNADVAAIRLRRAAGEKGVVLAQEFGVTAEHISRVVSGKVRGERSSLQ